MSRLKIFNIQKCLGKLFVQDVNKLKKDIVRRIEEYINNNSDWYVIQEIIPEKRPYKLKNKNTDELI